MITDKKITNEDTDLEMALSTVPTAQQAHDAILKEYNYKGTDGDRLYLVTDYVFFKAENMDDNSSLYMRNKSGYYVLWSNLCKNQGYDLIEYHKTVYNPKPTHEVPTLEYGSLEKNGCYILFYFDSESEEWQCLTGQNIAYYLSSYSGIGISLYPADRVTIMFNNKDLKLCRYVDFDTNTTDMYDYHIKANPLPDVLGNNTQIINYYFGDTVTVCEDVYNCVTNQITNNYYTENNYLLPTDPVDVGKDIIIPAQNIINNTYNSIDPDVTVDKDYIDKVLVPTIINGINANLDLNTDVNLPDLTIDDVVDFTGNAGDDYTLNTVTFFGLEEKFPFCLPWDVYYFLDCLDAEPRAPAFTVVIPLCSIGMEDCQLKIDLSELDYFFKMLRYAELFLACFGLVFLTKKIISGG